MDEQERKERLRRMLAQVAPEQPLETLPRAAADPMAELEGLGDPAEAAILTRAVSKVVEKRESDLNAPELDTLEAIVMPKYRPVVFIRKGQYENVADPWKHLNTEETRARLAPLIGSIGRIEVPGSPWIPYGGTGFVVGRNLLMTNRHVAKLFVEGLGARGLRYRAGDAAVDFKREAGLRGSDRAAYLTVTAVEMVHPFWDMALLRVEGLEGRFPALPLSTVMPEELLDADVAAIGYPARDDRNDLALQDRIFKRTYNVKRFQPGKLRRRERIGSFGNQVAAVTHDSSTLGGNSGSALIDIKSGKVIGLHFAGIYLKANYAVPAAELARDPRLARLGLNFDGQLPPTNDWEPAWQLAEGGEATATAAVPAPAALPGTTVTIPIQVTLTLGHAVAAGAAAAAPAIEIPLQTPIVYGGLERRKGYQPGFLELDGGDTVPLPELTDEGLRMAAKLEDGSTELRYHKFSVVVHKQRRMALFTAANTDWRDDWRKIDGRKPSRKELTGLPDRTAEQWVTDWRIPEEHQLPDAFYNKDGGLFDKGHIVRREDVCWGRTFKDIQKANGDTFHTTNCSPQVKIFNQSAQGEDNWGDLENLIQAQTRAERAIVFGGPVFEEDDPLFRGKGANNEQLLLRVPRRFWKIAVVKGSDGPEAYGFVLEQDLADMPVTPEEFAVPRRWRRYLRPIGEIEDMLDGLATLEWLKRHDRSGSPEAVRMKERTE